MSPDAFPAVGGADRPAVALDIVAAAPVRDAEPTPGEVSAPPESAEDPLASFEQRVRDHPDDLARDSISTVYRRGR